LENIVTEQPADYEALRSMIYRIKRSCPFVNCHVCGRSLSGRAIFVLSAGNPREPVLFTGGIHGTEWMTSLVILKFFERVCDSVKTGRRLCRQSFGQLLSHRGLAVIPCLNPDGVQIAIRGLSGAGMYLETVRRASGGLISGWDANARGVDLSRNFSAGWEAEPEAGTGSSATCRFGGFSPESEPETVALTNFCRRTLPRHALAFHGFGEEIRWRYGDSAPAHAELTAKIFSAASGYALAGNDRLCADGGFTEWFMSELKRPAFTMGMGKGKSPPLEAFGGIYETLEEMMVLAAIV